MSERELWAKLSPYKSLREHMFQTGHVMRILLTKSVYQCDFDLFRNCFVYDTLDDDVLLNTLCYLAAVHDLGKADMRFQRRADDEEYAKGFRHEYETGRFFRKYWDSLHYPADMLMFFGNVLASHHQKYQDNMRFRQSDSDVLLSEMNMESLHALLLQEYAPVLPKKVKNPDAVCYLLLGLIVLSDWLSSSDNLIKGNLETGILQFLSNTRLNGVNSWQLLDYQTVWSSIQKLSPMQQFIKDYTGAGHEVPMCCLIEDSPGSGKTEAALYMAARMMQAYQKSGVYIGLPTSATANAMFDRVNDMLDSVGVDKQARLMHSHAFMRDDWHGMSTDAERWLSPKRVGLLERNGVGTVDQVMLSVLPMRFACLRMLGLSSKVLIIDEIHAYDWYMQSILWVLLRYCKACRIPVILLSATLSEERKRCLFQIYCKQEVNVVSGYPLITMFYQDKSAMPFQQVIDPSFHRSYQIKTVSSVSLAVDDLVMKSQQGGCYCYIANTVGSAVNAYGALKKRLADTDVEVMLFHARFSACRRSEIETACVSAFGKNGVRPKKAILVATQVIEQSLDVDFDMIVSELAPMDLLVQRMGREHRHVRYDRPVKDAVFCVVNQNVHGVYGHQAVLVDNTWKLLERMSVFRIPEDVRSSIDAVSQDIAEDSIDKVFERQAGALGVRCALSKPKARISTDDGLFCDRMCLGETDDEDAVSSKTRNGDDSVEFALLPQDMFDRMVTDGHVARSDADWVRNHSVSYYFDNMHVFEKYKHCVGNGNLMYTWLFPATYAEQNNTYMSCFPEGTLYLDDEIGFRIVRKAGT